MWQGLPSPSRHWGSDSQPSVPRSGHCDPGPWHVIPKHWRAIRVTKEIGLKLAARWVLAGLTWGKMLILEATHVKQTCGCRSPLLGVLGSSGQQPGWGGWRWLELQKPAGSCAVGASWQHPGLRRRQRVAGRSRLPVHRAKPPARGLPLAALSPAEGWRRPSLAAQRRCPVRPHGLQGPHGGACGLCHLAPRWLRPWARGQGWGLRRRLGG